MKCVVGMVLALTLVGGATAAEATTSQPLYRTRHQAELYLEQGLQTWDNNSLGRSDLRAAYYIDGYSALPRRNKHSPRPRLNGSGVHTYRTFACTLYAQVKDPPQTSGHLQVYGLYLVTTQTGWQVTGLR